MRKWLAAALLVSIFTAGCMGGGAQQPSPQKAPEPDKDQVEAAVHKALSDPDMKDYLRTQVRAQAGVELIRLSLDTQEGQAVVHDAVRRTLTSQVGQQSITEQVSRIVTDPALRTHLTEAIRQTMHEVLARGAAPGAANEKDQKDQKGQKDQKDKSGGGQGGGGGGDGGGGGGGGGGGK